MHKTSRSTLFSFFSPRFLSTHFSFDHALELSLQKRWLSDFGRMAKAMFFKQSFFHLPTLNWYLDTFWSSWSISCQHSLALFYEHSFYPTSLFVVSTMIEVTDIEVLIPLACTNLNRTDCVRCFLFVRVLLHRFLFILFFIAIFISSCLHDYFNNVLFVFVGLDFFG